MSCESLGISRNEYYKFYDRDEDFRVHAEQCRERRIDFAESKLDRLIDQENPTAILFLLKTIGHKRGYTERQELDLTSKGESIKPINIIVENAEQKAVLDSLMNSDV